MDRAARLSRAANGISSSFTGSIFQFPLCDLELTTTVPTMRRSSFHSIYSHEFAWAAVRIPHVRVADPTLNAERTEDLARRASDLGAALALFPELGISADTNDDCSITCPARRNQGCARTHYPGKR